MFAPLYQARPAEGHLAKVSGFHATSIQVADMLLREQTTWEASNNEYDWLGTGIYFWQDDPRRAWEWTAQPHWPHLAQCGPWGPSGSAIGAQRRRMINPYRRSKTRW